jgi:sporulation protein YlmC with PRC-barrel domain
MLDESDLRSLVSREVVDPEGKSVGYVETVFRDRETGRLEWLGVMTGTWRHHHRLVPATEVERSATSVAVPFTKEQIQSAPEYEDPDNPISQELEERAYRHYGREAAVS